MHALVVLRGVFALFALYLVLLQNPGAPALNPHPHPLAAWWLCFTKVTAGHWRHCWRHGQRQAHGKGGAVCGGRQPDGVEQGAAATA